MGESIKTVAVLASSPALSSILVSVLREGARLRVRSFESLFALRTYMTLSPVDLVVCDFDCEASPADEVAETLRHDTTLARRDFQVVAMVRNMTRAIKQASIAAGVDEVIVKPMSPRYLLERVQARLKTANVPIIVEGGYHGPERRNRFRGRERDIVISRHYADNVVSLFPAN